MAASTRTNEARGTEHAAIGPIDLAWLAGRCELRPGRALRMEVQGLDDLLRRHVDDRDTAVARVRHPDFAFVRRQIDPFGPLADGDDRFVPRERIAPALHDGNAVGADV